MRYFGVININDKNAQTFIDGIRLLSSSKVKHMAHITLQGPKNDKNEIKFQSIRRNEQIVKVNGVGNFFADGQNTVFLKCNLDNGGQIRSMIDKPDYGNETPHITLYDGNDASFAEKLYNLTLKYEIQFQVIVSEPNYIVQESDTKKKSDLDIISSTKNYIDFPPSFYNHLNYYMGGTAIDANVIERLSKGERLEYIERLLSLFKDWKNHNVIPNPCVEAINELNFKEQNGLFFYDDIKKWTAFPTNIKQAIHQAKPYAFLTLQDINETKRFDLNLPFVFIYSNPTEKEEEILKQKVFNFGKAPIVIVHKTKIEIFNGLIYDRNKTQNLLDEYKITDFSFEKLVTQKFWNEHLTKHKEKGIYYTFLKNIKETRNYLIYEKQLPNNICNKLIGRLLFIRYFIDRGVSFKKEDGSCFFNNSKDEFAEVIKNKEDLYLFFKYFKEKYNGDLFPINEEEINSVTNEHLIILSILFRGGEFHLQNKSFYIQESLFDIYDFSIIPIELVSNVYESFMGESSHERKDESIQVKNKAFYTPFVLADFVLENTIGKYLKQEINYVEFSCPVLDPSCGSGIFLVEALRKIIERKIELNNSPLEREDIWNCVTQNIFGIDIDENAIDIAIFSIYVTILDYISPLEISEDFKFRNLKDSNFFSSDFFNTNNKFNKILRKIPLKFIIGNPPWGQIKSIINGKEIYPYMDYCLLRAQIESIGQKKNVEIEISDKQIAQAFLIRVSDFFTSEGNTLCAFVVTSKLLYNANARKWRKYFLNSFSVSEIYEFSPVRNYIFDDAAWPTMVIFYSKKNIEEFEYFSINSKEFSKRFNSFSIDQQSRKKIPQKELLKLNSNYNWFWKTLLYGSFFDFFIIKRIKEQYRTIFDYIEDYGLEYGVGLKRKDGNKNPNASNLVGYKFIDTHKKELQQFVYNSSNNWSEKTAGNIPQGLAKDNFPILFTPPLALIKEGLTPDIKGVAAFSNEKVVFTHSIRAIKGNKNNIDVLKSIVGLINSDLFSYYILHTGSSVGVDLTRANQIEQFSFPIILSKEISTIVDEISKLDILSFTYEQEKTDLLASLNKKIFKLYNFNNIEIDFIDYTVKYIIPSIKQSITKKINNEKGLVSYMNVFANYFDSIQSFYKISYHITKEFVGIFFAKKELEDIFFTQIENNNINSILNLYANLTFEQISKFVFLKKNIIEMSNDRKLYCIIKSNNVENWQNANAWLDLANFIKNIISPQKNLYDIYENLYNSEQESEIH
jgi:hypothetical protein